MLVILCDCLDHGCPTHLGFECEAPLGWKTPKRRVYRIDMDDQDGLLICLACAEDALESGVFTTR